MNVVEGKDSGSLVVEGKIGHCDVPTANGRVYPRSVMEREIKRLAPRIEQASVYAAVDHPGDGKTRLKDAGAIVRGLWVEPSGEIHGRFEVVEEAPAGQAIAAFLRRGASVGMSSRGLGSTTTSANGYDVVGEDFRLNTWDFVSDPACHDAYPALMSEDEEQKVTVEHLRARFPKLVQQIEESAYVTAQLVCEDVGRDELRAEVEHQAEEALKQAKVQIREDVKVEVYEEVRDQMRADFATKLVRAIAEMREQITEEVRSNLSSDPSIAGAKITLQKITEMLAPYKPAPDIKKMLDEKNSASAELQRKLTTLENEVKRRDAAVAHLEQHGRKLAYALFVEQQVSGRIDAESVKKLVGPLEQVKSVEDLRKKVESAIAEADKTRELVVAEANNEIERIKADYERKLADERAEVARARGSMSGVIDRIEAIEASFTKVITEKDQEIAAVRAIMEEKEEQLVEALAASQQVALRAYAQQRTAGHPRAAEIMQSITEGEITTRNDVDRMATKLEEQAQEPGGVRERIRRAMSAGREARTEDERKVADTSESATLQESSEAANDLREVGLNLNEAIKLTGGVRPARR